MPSKSSKRQPRKKRTASSPAPDSGRSPSLPIPIIGVGGSAGGIEAFAEFLRALPSDSEATHGHGVAETLRD